MSKLQASDLAWTAFSKYLPFLSKLFIWPFEVLWILVLPFLPEWQQSILRDWKNGDTGSWDHGIMGILCEWVGEGWMLCTHPGED